MGRSIRSTTQKVEETRKRFVHTPGLKKTIDRTSKWKLGNFSGIVHKSNNTHATLEKTRTPTKKRANLEKTTWLLTKGKWGGRAQSRLLSTTKQRIG